MAWVWCVSSKDLLRGRAKWETSPGPSPSSGFLSGLFHMSPLDAIHQSVTQSKDSPPETESVELPILDFQPQKVSVNLFS